MYNKVIEGLRARGIHPITGPSDGTETERSLQDLVKACTPKKHAFSIANSYHSKAVAHLSIPLLSSRYPFILIQDSKHGRKT
jgi:hypothetical protein